MSLPDRPFHPLADIFPLLAEKELAALAADIAANGLREPIWLDAEGAILDGRNRYLACKRAGVEPRFRTWDGQGSAAAFVVSLNLHRRHLNETQRATVAAKIANMGRGNPSLQLSISEISPIGISVGEAAAMLNVSSASVVNARKVLRDGTPDEIAACEAGTAAAGTLAKEIRRKVPPEQRAARRGKPLAHVGKNPERIEKQRIDAEVWGRLRESLLHLTALPSPSDIVAIARAHDKRRSLVDDKVGPALNWLQEFCHEWSKRDAA